MKRKAKLPRANKVRVKNEDTGQWIDVEFSETEINKLDFGLVCENGMVTHFKVIHRMRVLNEYYCLRRKPCPTWLRWKSTDRLSFTLMYLGIECYRIARNANQLLMQFERMKTKQ
jgi:hypothetical protein